MPNLQQLNQDNFIQIAALAGLLFVSAFASSSETAFFSLNRFQIRRIRDRYRASYEKIRTLLGHPTRLLVMILLVNEITNITISSLVAQLFQANFSSVLRDTLALTPNRQWLATTFISVALTLPLLLFFGEITPKVVAARMNRIIAIVNSRVLMVLYRALFPILWTADGVISFFLRRLKAEGRDHLSKTMSVLSEEDFLILMEEGHKEGTVDPRERKLITNVFEFDDSTVAEVMTPLTQVCSIPATAKVTDILPEIRMQKYSRVPIHHKSKQNLVGVLYVKDLLPLRNNPKLADVEVRSLMTTPMVVGSNVRLSVLFRRFKEAKTHMAVVVSRTHGPETGHGGGEPGYDGPAVGIVTMEDVLESIFGEISDERDVR